jgi:ankyrin repeat protein
VQEVPLDAETELRLAGADYEEWLQAQDEHEARLQEGRRHKETDHGQGYLEGRWGKDDIMGWTTYKPLSLEQLAVPEVLAREPLYRLNRHLLFAAQTGDVPLIRMLLHAGAHVDTSNNESFLPATVRFGLNEPNSHAPITEKFSGTYGGVDPEIGEAQIAVYKWPPLHWAASAGHAEAVAVLVAPRAEGGAEAALNATDWINMTALHWAAGGGHARTVVALLQAGAASNASDSSGNTPLHMAVWQGHVDAMQALLEGGAAVDAGNTGGFTPLHWAASQNQERAARLLLEHGANPRQQNEDYLTPLNVAEAAVAPPSRTVEPKPWLLPPFDPFQPLPLYPIVVGQRPETLHPSPSAPLRLCFPQRFLSLPSTPSHPPPSPLPVKQTPPPSSSSPPLCRATRSWQTCWQKPWTS